MAQESEAVADEDAREEARDEGYDLDRKAVARILYAVDTDDREQLVELMEPLHPADIADLLEQVNAYDRMRLIRLYGHEMDGDILSELDEALREEVIGILTPQVLAEAVRELDSDDVVDLIEDLDTPQQTAILDVLPESERAAVEQSLAYPEFSAGRLMQREVVMAPEHWSVGEAIDFLRSSKSLPEQFYHIVLVDPRLRPVGNVTLGRLMSSKRDVTLKSIQEESFHTIPVMQYEGEVAYAFNQYHLISAPVVDENDRLVGQITIDDAMAVLDEENEEDILRLAGVDGPYSVLLSADVYTKVSETTAHGYPIREHLNRLVDGEIIWAPAIDGAFVLSTRGGDFDLQLGTDVCIGYLSHDADSVALYLQETMTFLCYTAEASVALTA